jgi:hypothetical protein
MRGARLAARCRLHSARLAAPLACVRLAALGVPLVVACAYTRLAARTRGSRLATLGALLVRASSRLATLGAGREAGSPRSVSRI